MGAGPTVPGASSAAVSVPQNDGWSTAALTASPAPMGGYSGQRESVVWRLYKV